MAWLLGILGRILVFGVTWAILTAALLAVALGLDATPDPDDLLGAVRTGLLGALWLMVAHERQETNKAVSMLSGRDFQTLGDRTGLVAGTLAFPFLLLWFALVEPLLVVVAFQGGSATPQEWQGIWIRSLPVSAFWSVLFGSIVALLRTAPSLTLARVTSELEDRSAVPDAAPLAMSAFAGGWALLTLFSKAAAALVVLALVLRKPEDLDAREEIIVWLGPDDHASELFGTILAHDATVDRLEGRAVIVTVPPRRLEALQRALDDDDENVEVIELNSAVTTGVETAGLPCSLPSTPPAAARTVTVAIIDTGVQLPRGWNHRVQGGGVDRIGHGTAMASLVLQYPGTRVLDLPTLASPRARADDVAEAIDDAVAHGAQVISLSFSGTDANRPRLVQEAVARATAQGILVLAATGNRHDRAPTPTVWPAGLPGVTAVGALDRDQGSEAPFSKPAPPGQDAMRASGTGLCVFGPDGRATQQSGTSHATANLAGMLASVAAECGLHPRQVRTAVQAERVLTREQLRARVCGH